MNTLTKAMVGTVAAGAMAVSAASPALARDNDRGIDAGEVIAGAVIIGGIAAVVAAASKDRNRDRYGYGYRQHRDYRYQRAGYNYRSGNPRRAVKRCVRAAEREASRYSHGRADVTRVTSIRNKRNGFDVKGRIAVDDRGRNWRRGGYDTGKFTCKVRYGRIDNIRYSGLRGLR